MQNQINYKDVSNYILSLVEPDSGELISNLKMQKLLYYVQGFTLAMLDSPMFSEEIQHWTHGPVVPEAYHAFKNYNTSGIPTPSHLDFSMFSDKQMETMNDVYNVYGQYSAWKLRQLTHEELPWTCTKDNEVISHSLMKDFFKRQIH